MNRTWALVFAWIFIAYSTTFIAGCTGGGAEIAALESIKAANEAERSRLYEIAMNLDQFKSAADKAAADMREIELWRSDGDAAARMKAFAANLGTARASYVKDGGDWRITITGTGGGAAA